MDEFLERLRITTERAWRWIRQRVGEWWEDRRATQRASTALDPERRLREAREGRGEPTESAEVIVVHGRDDVASLTGRIETARSPEVVLVVRREARALRNPGAWPHLAAHARRRGIALGVVSTRADVRAYARRTGLRASATAAGLRRRGDPRLRFGGRNVALPLLPWGGFVRAGVLTAVVVGIVIVACYQVPSAVIEISPQSSEIATEMRLRPNPLIEASDITAGVVRATTVRETIETVVSTATTGETEVGDEHAAVQLRFENDGAAAVRVPAGTRIATEDDIGFITDEEVEVAAGQQATVRATAELPGTAGNVPRGRVSIGPDLPRNVLVTNTSEGAGGTDRVVPAVAREDMDTIRSIAEEVLTKIGEGHLAKIVPAEAIIPGTVAISIFSEQPRQQLDEPARALIVDYEIVVTALVLTEQERARVGEQMLSRALPAGQALLPGTSTVSVLDDPGGDAQTIRLRARGYVVPIEGLAELSSDLAGARPGAASVLLQERLQLQEMPRITINPSFLPWRWLPQRADRIEIRLVAPPVPDTTPVTPTATPTATPDEPEPTVTPTPSAAAPGR